MGTFAGAVGGLTASFAMNQFQSAWTAAEKKLARQAREKGSGGGDDATVKAANRISKNLLGHDLTEPEKKWAGPAVHYAFGSLVGAVYGGMAERMPAARAGIGTAYGSAVWLLADEIGVPATGLSRPPTASPPTAHAKALASHLVYGLVTDLTRRAVLKAVT